MNIALKGLMGSGKTTASDILVKERSLIKCSFGTEVKYIASLILGREINKSMDGDRELLQDIGEVFKGEKSYQPFLDKWMASKDFTSYYLANVDDFGEPYYFAKKLCEQCDFLKDFEENKVVIDDIRYAIEYAYLITKSVEIFGNSNNILSVEVVLPKSLCIKRLKERDNLFKESYFDRESEKQFNTIFTDGYFVNYDFECQKEFNYDEFKQEVLETYDFLCKR